MTDEKKPEDITQPIRVPPAKDPLEDTNQVVLDPVQESTLDLPDWLLDFANQPDPDENAMVIEKVEVIQATEDVAEENGISPAVALETSEWQPVQAELESPEGSESLPLDELSLDPVSELGSLLSDGKYKQFVEKIKQLPLTEENRQTFKQKLRSHLTLSDNASQLWDVYDDLNKPIG